MLLLVANVLAADTCVAFGAADASGVVDDMPAFESSGVARYPDEAGTWYTHGDNGDAATLYVFRDDGSYAGEQAVRGAENVDWEDLANGPCLGGDGACLWIADIGDNDEERESVTLYLVPATLDAAVDATVCVLAYPGGKRDNAEALLVFPDRTVRVVTKHSDGGATVYRLVDPACDGRTETLEEEAEIVLDGAVTGGAVSEDGATVVLRTYTDAWMWQGCTLDWSAEPVPVDLGSEAQGEAIAFTTDGGLVTTSEGSPFRFRTIPCAETGEVPCPTCGCGGKAAGAWWVPFGAWAVGRRRRQTGGPPRSR